MNVFKILDETMPKVPILGFIYLIINNKEFVMEVKCLMYLEKDN
jgi:hypothetical protein